VKGKLVNGVVSQYSSHYLGIWYIPADLNGLVRFTERRNLISARVPSPFKRSLPEIMAVEAVAFGRNVSLSLGNIVQILVTKPFTVKVKQSSWQYSVRMWTFA